jgi:hypothetical protein
MSQGDRTELYDTPEPLFAGGGNAVAKLTDRAAAAACAAASELGLVVVRVEGGIWRDPGFEARGDCIWDGIDPPASAEEATRNNLRAADFIESEKAGHSVFILTTASVNGYSHKRNVP